MNELASEPMRQRLREAPGERRVPALEITGLTVTYRSRAGRVAALTGVDVTVAPGEVVGLVGGSGAGKSTVARAVAGLVRPDRGTIRVAGSDVVGVGRAALRRVRRTLHLVFQDPYAALPPTLRVGDVIAEPLLVHRIGDRAARGERAAHAAAAVGLDRRLLQRYPHELSGGERQRVAFARALVSGPRLILADEPTQMLDASLRRDLADLIGRLAAEQGIAVLHITHDLALAQHSCVRLVVMSRGRVVESGPTADVLARPRHDHTAALVAAAIRR
jgi:peptide/nickel transport system ATP-binding protein